MRIVMGVDPGINTGIAVFVDGVLTETCAMLPWHCEKRFIRETPDLIVMEDSRAQGVIWNRGNSAQAPKIARSVGTIDAWCSMFEYWCKQRGIALQCVSPKDKGAKLNAKQFREITKFESRISQHERDAAMVAWPYRHSRGSK